MKRFWSKSNLFDSAVGIYTMGCSTSLEKLKIQPFPFHCKKTIDLTEKQRKLIKSTWILIERRKNDLGVDIFLRLEFGYFNFTIVRLLVAFYITLYSTMLSIISV